MEKLLEQTHQLRIHEIKSKRLKKILYRIVSCIKFKSKTSLSITQKYGLSTPFQTKTLHVIII
jgi:hypothetical protein